MAADGDASCGERKHEEAILHLTVMLKFPKFSALALCVVKVSSLTICETKFQGRQEELKQLHLELTKKKFFILTGPKQVGKSSLVKEIKRLDSYSDILLFDLRSKKNSEEVEEELKLKITEFNNNINRLHILEEVKTESNSSKSVLEYNLENPGSSNRSKNSTEVVTRTGLKNVDINRDDVPDPVQALRSVLSRIISHNQQSIFFWNRIPSCIIIDEAQTLKHLGETRVNDLVDTFVTFGRDTNMTVLLVTSDYSAVEAFVGKKIFISLIMCTFLRFAL